MSGIDHLNKFGKFHEIIAGNKWNNNGMIRYVGEMGEEASTPKILITIRTYTDSLQTNITDEKRIISITGSNKIIEWIKIGALLPHNFIKEFNTDEINN